MWAFAAPNPPALYAVTEVHDNDYYLPATTPAIYECGLPLAEYQASCADCDARSTGHIGFPEDAVILTAARAALSLQK